MMHKTPRVITGLDIGSSKVSLAVAEVRDDGSLDFIAHKSLPSKGIARGAITDLNEAVDSISRVFSKAAPLVSKAGFGDIFVNMTGPAIKGERAKGMIPLNLRGREITKADIERCVNVASTIRLTYDREILHKIRHNFSIDDQPWIADPLGLYASKLACEIYVITAGVNNIQNIYKCVNNAGYDVSEIVLSGLADGMAFLDAGQRQEGAAVVNIGASLTEYSAFAGGVLKDMDIIPAGMNDVGPDFDGSAEFDAIAARLKMKIDEFANKNGTVNSILLAGGASFKDGAVECLEEKLSRPIRIASVKDIKGNISSLESMSLATAIGLVKYASEKLAKRANDRKAIVRRLSEKVVDVFNHYF